MSELKCPSCHEWYDEEGRIPKETRCRHNVCSTCVMNLLGEPVRGDVKREPLIPMGRIFNCPVCHGEVRTEAINTNRTIASKINALIGLESMIMDDSELPPQLTSRHPKPQQPQPQHPPQPFQPQPQTQKTDQQSHTLGWAKPTEKPTPEIPGPLHGDQLGWSHQGPLPHGAEMNPNPQMTSMPVPPHLRSAQDASPQYQPQPQGGSAPYPSQPYGGSAPYPSQPQGGSAPYPPHAQSNPSPYPPQPQGGSAPYPPHPQSSSSPYPPQPQGGSFPYPPQASSTHSLSSQPQGVLGFSNPPPSSGSQY